MNKLALKLGWLAWMVMGLAMPSVAADGLEELRAADAALESQTRGTMRNCWITNEERHRRWANGRVLFVVSGAQPGYWGEELQAPVAALKEKGFGVVIASVDGKTLLDPASAPDPDTAAPNDPRFAWTPFEVARKVIALDKAIQGKVKVLSSIDMNDFGAVVIVGGHGAMFDLNGDVHVHRIILDALVMGRIVAAECHGTGALAFTGDLGGHSVIEGRKVTGFPAAWEPAGLKLPYVLQDELSSASGGRYDTGLQAGQNPQPFVVDSGNIITSRDPMSSSLLGFTLVQKLTGGNR